jgi:hypothetical protein
MEVFFSTTLYDFTVVLEVEAFADEALPVYNSFKPFSRIN